VAIFSVVWVLFEAALVAIFGTIWVLFLVQFRTVFVVIFGAVLCCLNAIFGGCEVT